MEELVQLTKHSFFQKTVTSHKFIIYAIVANVELVFKAVGEKLNITLRNQLLLCVPAYTELLAYTHVPAVQAEPGYAAVW